jgi:competence protein ComEA
MHLALWTARRSLSVAGAAHRSTLKENPMKRLLVLLAGLMFSGLALALVNVNTATLQELEALNGIGPVKAQAIIDHRKANGPFKSIEQLKDVKGIGDATFDKIKADVSVTGANTPPAKTVGGAASAPTKAEAAKATPAAPATPAPAAPMKAEPAKAAPASPAAPATPAMSEKNKKAADAKAAKEEKAAKAKAAKEEKAAKAKAAKEEKAAKEKAAKDDKAAKDKAAMEDKAAKDKAAAEAKKSETTKK